jgi:hypothetical protein
MIKYFIREYIIRENIICFTHINTLLFTLCYFKPYSNYLDYDNLYSISYCWNCLIFVSFNGANIIDNTCFKRMAIRKKLPLPIFHIGNMIFHILPFLYISIYIPKNVLLYHSFLACITNLLWCYWATFGTFDFEHIYVYMKKKHQKTLYIINISSILYAPLTYHINKTIRSNLLYLNII